MNVIELASAYVEIQNKYDSGKNYTWEDAYTDLKILEANAHGTKRRARTPEGKLLARLLCEEIAEEKERVVRLCMQYKEKENT